MSNRRRMHILITGADGFIGNALAQALLARGHRLTLAVRDPQHAAARFPGQRVLAADFAIDHSPGAWRSRLDGVDAVVNTVGIFREQGAQTFEAIHVRAPAALFEACVDAGVRRVVQISALGAAADAPTEFLRSKHAADTALASLPLSSSWCGHRWCSRPKARARACSCNSPRCRWCRCRRAVRNACSRSTATIWSPHWSCWSKPMRRRRCWPRPVLPR